jgi:hypothetical protein
MAPKGAIFILMTNDEKVALIEILTSTNKPWEARGKALEFVKTAPLTEAAPEKPKTRTAQQNKALHLYFTMVAEELNNGGLDIRAVIKPDVNVPWTSYMVKEYLWRPVQKLALGKESTTDLEKLDIDKVFDIFNAHIAKFGVHIPFPSNEHRSDLLEGMKIDVRKNSDYPEYKGEVAFE